jgi:predicted DNA-binding transcriptional regulator AlpA
MNDLAVTLTVEQLKALIRESVREEVAKAPAAPAPEVLTLEGCADLLDLSTKTVSKLEREAGLPSHELSPGDRRFRRSEVLAWLSARGRAA